MHRRHFAGAALFAAVVSFSGAITAHAQTGISIHLGSDQGGIVPAASAAGVVALTNFNNFTAAANTGGNSVYSNLSLVDSTGTASAAKLAFSGVGSFATNTNVASGANYVLMHGYLDDGNGTSNTVVSLTNIPYSSYTVYVYTAAVTTAGANNFPAVRVADYALSSALTGNKTIRNTQDHYEYTAATGFVSQSNYVAFTGVSGSAFTVTGTPVSASDPFLRAAINGIQIVPNAAAPEPSALALLAAPILGAGLTVVRRKRKSHA